MPSFLFQSHFFFSEYELPATLTYNTRNMWLMSVWSPLIRKSLNYSATMLLWGFSYITKHSWVVYTHQHKRTLIVTWSIDKKDAKQKARLYDLVAFQSANRLPCSLQSLKIKGEKTQTQFESFSFYQQMGTRQWPWWNSSWGSQPVKLAVIWNTLRFTFTAVPPPFQDSGWNSFTGEHIAQLAHFPQQTETTHWQTSSPSPTLYLLHFSDISSIIKTRFWVWWMRQV